jgi:hypothetical protein
MFTLIGSFPSWASNLPAHHEDAVWVEGAAAA